MMLIISSEFFKKWIFQKMNLKSELWKVSFWISKSKFWKESEFPKINFQKWKSEKKPFPNGNPNTKISYIELDIIVSKLVWDTKYSIGTFIKNCFYFSFRNSCSARLKSTEGVRIMWGVCCFDKILLVSQDTTTTLSP